MREIWRKLRTLGRRAELAQRLREELEFHAARKAADSGQTVVAARRDLGNQTRLLEAADDVWALRCLEHLWKDVRYAVRALSRSSGFFLLAAAGTALGVAAVTAVWSVAGTVLIRPLAYPDADRLVVVSDQLLKLGFTRFPIATANYLDYRARNRVLQDIAAFQPATFTVVAGDRAQRIGGMSASANLLSVLGVFPERGRWFDPRENHGVPAGVVVLSHAFWLTHREPLLRVDNRSYQVVGVLPEGFTFRLGGEPPSIWLPVNLDAPSRDAGSLQAVARLKPGVSASRAQAAMAVIADELKRQYRTGMGPHGEDGQYRVAVTPLRQELYGGARATLYALAAAGVILLLLGLGNTAMLWLGRAAARQSEAAVRLALGATPRRVVLQFAIEALLPSLTGGLLALALTLGALAWLNAAPPSELATVGRFAIDLPVFGFAILLSAAAGILFGTLPMRSVIRAGAGGSPIAGGRGGIGARSESRARPLLIALQVAFACALLVPSLLLIQSLSALENVDPGFRVDNLQVARVSLASSRYRTGPEIAAWYQRLYDRLAAWRGAPNVSMVSQLPLTFGTGGDPFSIEGRAWGASGTVPQFAHQVSVGPNYFSLARIPLHAGRDFESRDFAAPDRVAVVNQTLAQAFWPRESALGKRIVMGAPGPHTPWMTIVGVVADVHTAELSRPPLPQIYQPFSQAPVRSMSLIVSGVDGAGLQKLVHAADSQTPAYLLETMQHHVAGTLNRPRLRTELFTSYGLIAFLLAGFGIYSMTAYSVIRRRREFALRAALGARPSQLMAAALRGILPPAALGALCGTAAAYAIARGIESSLYGVGASEGAIYALALMLALGAAAVASVLGGRDARHVAPADILRAD